MIKPATLFIITLPAETLSAPTCGKRGKQQCSQMERRKKAFGPQLIKQPSPLSLILLHLKKAFGFKVNSVLFHQKDTWICYLTKISYGPPPSPNSDNMGLDVNLTFSGKRSNLQLLHAMHARCTASECRLEYALSASLWKITAVEYHIVPVCNCSFGWIGKNGLRTPALGHNRPQPAVGAIWFFKDMEMPRHQ